MAMNKLLLSAALFQSVPGGGAQDKEIIFFL